MDWMDGEGEEELYGLAQPHLVVSQSTYSEKNSEKKSIKNVLTP